MSAHDRKLLFWDSFLGNFLFSVFMLFGVAAPSAVAPGVVMAAIPVAVTVRSRLFLGERIQPRVRAAVGCAAAGLATWTLLVFYAIAASMVTVWLWMQGLRHVPAP